MLLHDRGRRACRALARSVTTGLAILAAMSATGSPASAHSAGLEPVRTQAEILAIEPAVPGLSVSLIDAGSRLRVDNGTAVTASVTPAADRVRTVEPVAGPGETVRWVDPRLTIASREMAAAPPGSSTTWTIEIALAEQSVRVLGQTTRPPPPAAAAWWVAALLTAIGAAIAGALAVRWRPAAVVVAVLTGAVVVAHVVHVLGSALVPDELSYWPTVAGTAGLGLGAWLAGVVGMVLTLRKHRYGLLLCSLAGALLALVTGGDSASFSNAVLPFGLAPTLDRVSTVLTFGAGFGLFLTGFSVLRQFAEAVDDSSEGADPWPPEDKAGAMPPGRETHRGSRAATTAGEDP